MRVFKDIITGDEMFTDTYDYKKFEEAFYMVVGKQVIIKEGDIQLEGANPSAEEVDEGTDVTTQSGVDVILYMRLQETGFPAKKDFLLYMKSYLKSLKDKLEAEKPGSSEGLKDIQAPLVNLLKNFKDLQFFTGESMNPDGMVALMDYKEIDGEERPVIYFLIPGLVEEKL